MGEEGLAVVLLITGLPPVQVEPPIKYLFWPAKLSIPAIVTQFPPDCHTILSNSIDPRLIPTDIFLVGLSYKPEMILPKHEKNAY